MSSNDTLSDVGAARKYQNQTASQVLSTLGPLTAYAAGFFIIFLVLRRLVPRVYSPRSFVTALRPHERTPELPKGFFNGFRAFYRLPDHLVLHKQSLDGYMFLRLLRVSVASCVVGCLITWPILLPVNATGAGNSTQLNILTFSNVASPSQPESYYRYYAHAVCAYLFFGFIIYMITRETIYFINLRQAYLVSPIYANRVSSRTVLFSSVPDEYLDADILRQLLGEDLVLNVWIPRHISKLQNLVEERDGVALKLENAEIELIKKSNKARQRLLKKDPEQAEGEELSSLNGEDRMRKDSENSTASTRWLDVKERPTHRLKFLVGDKVDTIDWCRKELTRLIPKVESIQHDHRLGKGKAHNSAFVEFKSLRDAQSAFQSLTHHQAARMSPRFTGMYPEEIIWSNLRIKWWERTIRQFLIITFVVGLIVLWTFPVLFIQSISNIGYLSTIKPLAWLSFIDRLPKTVSGLVTGLLPSILLAVVMSLLPPVLRLAHQLAGEPTYSAVEFSLQNSYFWFQLIQVFLVTTLSNGAISAVIQIYHNPQSLINLLAEALPASSNFYLSYVIVQGLGVVSQTLLAILSLLLYYGLGGLLDKTPRGKYNRWISLNNPGLGSTYPIYTNLLIIAISYSCVAPLVMGFAAVGLFLFYLAYRYEFLFVYNVPYDTKGLMYARALQQLFVGLYLAELCLIGLFATQLPNSKKVLGPLILMIIFLVFTVLYHYSLNRAFDPLLKYLPKTLETEEQRLLAMEMSEGDGEEYPEYKGPDAPGLRDVPTQPINRRATDLAEDKAKANWLLRWFRPDKYYDYYTLRRTVPHNLNTAQYDAELESRAYFHPAVTAEPPVLWVPRDLAGVSTEECRETSKVIPMSDEGGAVLNSKGELIWDWRETERVPIAKKKIDW